MRHWHLLLLAALGTASACTGEIGGSQPDGDGETSGCPGCTDSGIQISESSQFPRLSHAQWENTIVDLFGLDAPVGLSSSFLPDPLGGKIFDNNEASLAVTSGLWGDYQSSAETIATMITADAALLANIAPDDLPTEPTARRDAFLASFVKQAYRRPPSAEEAAQATSVFDQGIVHYPAMDAFTAGVRTTIEYVLQSPAFVYRPELGVNFDPATRLITLSNHEMASRLSYALFDSMPDPELMRAADAGELDQPDLLAAQVDRMLATPRVRQTMGRFYDQVLRATQYDAISKNQTLYPYFAAGTGTEMRQELAKFIDHNVFEADAGIAELLTSRTTFVNPTLATIYGIDPQTLDTPDADGFSQVELDPATRAGLLTLSGFLAYKGTETQPDTILRGVFVNMRILCQDLGDPPDEAMGAQFGGEVTNRERVNALTGPGTCGSTCHGSYINPIGFAFEHYGAAGEYREEDNGAPVNSSATYSFENGEQSYQNALELSSILASSPQVHACHSKHWIEFSLGRTSSPTDRALIDTLSLESQAGASVREVVRSLLTSDAIRYRLAPEAQ